MWGKERWWRKLEGKARGVGGCRERPWSQIKLSKGFTKHYESLNNVTFDHFNWALLKGEFPGEGSGRRGEGRGKRGKRTRGDVFNEVKRGLAVCWSKLCPPKLS